MFIGGFYRNSLAINADAIHGLRDSTDEICHKILHFKEIKAVHDFDLWTMYVEYNTFNCNR